MERLTETLTDGDADIDWLTDSSGETEVVAAILEAVIDSLLDSADDIDALQSSVSETDDVLDAVGARKP